MASALRKYEDVDAMGRQGQLRPYAGSGSENFDELGKQGKLKPLPMPVYDRDPSYVAPEPEPTEDETAKPKKSGILESMARSTGGILAGAGELTGIQSLEDYGAGLERKYPASVTSFGGALKDPGQALKEGASEAVPQLGVTAGGSGIGAGVGFAVGGPPGAAIGAPIGGWLSTFGSELGSIRREQEEEGTSDWGKAITGAGAAATLDVLAPIGRVGRKIGLGLVRKVTGDVVEETAEQSVKRGVQSGVRAYAGRRARDFVVEGGTEGLQTPIEQWAAGKDVLSPESIDESLLSAVKGGAGGVTIGAAADPFEARRDETAPDGKTSKGFDPEMRTGTGAPPTEDLSDTGVATPQDEGAAAAQPATAAQSSAQPPAQPSGGGYDTQFGSGKYGDPAFKASERTMGEVYDYGQRVLRPATKADGWGKGKDGRVLGTSAIGKYQFVSGTMARLAKKRYGSDWRNITFSPGVQEQLAEDLFHESKKGNLKAVWEGLPDATPGAYANMTWEQVRPIIAQVESGGGPVAPGAAATTEQAEALETPAPLERVDLGLGEGIAERPGIEGMEDVPQVPEMVVDPAAETQAAMDEEDAAEVRQTIYQDVMKAGDTYDPEARFVARLKRAGLSPVLTDAERRQAVKDTALLRSRGIEAPQVDVEAQEGRAGLEPGALAPEPKAGAAPQAATPQAATPAEPQSLVAEPAPAQQIDPDANVRGRVAGFLKTITDATPGKRGTSIAGWAAKGAEDALAGNTSQRPDGVDTSKWYDRGQDFVARERDEQAREQAALAGPPVLPPDAVAKMSPAQRQKFMAANRARVGDVQASLRGDEDEGPLTAAPTPAKQPKTPRAQRAARAKAPAAEPSPEPKQPKTERARKAVAAGRQKKAAAETPAAAPAPAPAPEPKVEAPKETRAQREAREAQEEADARKAAQRAAREAAAKKAAPAAETPAPPQKAAAERTGLTPRTQRAVAAKPAPKPVVQTGRRTRDEEVVQAIEAYDADVQQREAFQREVINNDKVVSGQASQAFAQQILDATDDDGDFKFTFEQVKEKWATLTGQVSDLSARSREQVASMVTAAGNATATAIARVQSAAQVMADRQKNPSQFMNGVSAALGRVFSVPKTDGAKAAFDKGVAWVKAQGIDKGDPLLNRELTDAEKATLAEHYETGTFNDEAGRRLSDDVVKAINQGIEKIAAAIRPIIARLMAVALAIHLVFNPVSLQQGGIVSYGQQAQAATMVETVAASSLDPALAAKLSPNARIVAEDLIPTLGKGQFAGKATVLADKPGGRIYVFDAKGELAYDGSALFGADAGDVLAEGKKITPSGRYKLMKRTGRLDYDTGVTFVAKGTADKGGIIAIHSVWKGSAAEQRAQRLETPTAADNRISFGCINTDTQDFKDAILPLQDQLDGGEVVIVPDAPLAAKATPAPAEKVPKPAPAQQKALPAATQRAIQAPSARKGGRKRTTGGKTPPPPKTPPAATPAPAQPARMQTPIAKLKRRSVARSSSNLAFAAKNLANTGVTWLASTNDVQRMAHDKLPAMDDLLDVLRRSTAEGRVFLERTSEIMDEYHSLATNRRGTGVGTLSDFVHDSTMSDKWGFEPKYEAPKGSSPEVVLAYKAFNDKVVVDPDLKAAFDKLPPKEQGIVKAVFRMGFDIRNTLRQAGVSATEAEYGPLLEAAKTDEERAELNKERDRAMRQISRIYDTRDGIPYAPLMRDGDWGVVGKSADYLAAEAADDKALLDKLSSDPQHYYVNFARSAHEAENLRKDVATQFNKANGGRTVRFQRDSVEDNPLAGISNAELYLVFKRMQNAIESKLDTDDAGKKAMQRLARDFYLNGVTEFSALKGELRRKKVSSTNPQTGEKINMMRAFVTRSEAMANYISAMSNNAALQDAIKRVEAQRDALDGDDYTEAQRMLNEVKLRIAYNASRRPSRTVGRFLKASSLMTLLTVPGYYIQNGMQTIMATVPILASRFGYPQTWFALLKAYGTFFKMTRGRGLSDRTVLRNVPEHLQDMIHEMLITSRLDSGHSVELGSWETDGYGLLGQGWNTIDRFTRRMPQYIETMNRVTTAIATYELATKKRGKKPGMSPKEATKLAGEIIDDTQGAYDGWNQPSIFRQTYKVAGEASRIPLQFRMYQFISGTMIAREFVRVFKGKTVKEKAQGAQAIVFLLAHLQVMSGIVGMPGSELLGDIVFSMIDLFDDDDDDMDWSEWRNRFREGVGAGSKGEPNWFADFLYKGVPYAGGVDLSGKVGMANVATFFPYVDLKAAATDKNALYKAAFKIFGGATGGIVAKAVDAADWQQSEGDWVKFFASIMPGAANIEKAISLKTEGLKGKDQLTYINPEDIGYDTALTVLMGLNTSQLANQQEEAADTYNVTEHYKRLTSKMKDQYWLAYSAGDTERMAALRDTWTGAVNNARERDGLKPASLKTMTGVVGENIKAQKGIIGGVKTTKTTRGFVEELTR